MLTIKEIWKQRKVLAGFIFYVVLVIYALITVFPLVWLGYTSLKTNNEVFMNPWALPGIPQLQNYIEAWKVAKMSLYMRNSVMVALVCLLFSLLIGSMAAYGIARFKTAISKYSYVYFIFGILVPVHTVLIPLYVLMSKLKLVNTIWALFSAYTAFSIPISIFILAAALSVIPNELEESGIIDGCNAFQVFFHIILPISKPTLATVAILNFLSFWNEYIFALIFTSNDAIRTLPVGLANFRGQYAVNYSTMAAGMMIAIIPSIIVYVLMQENVIEGMTAGAVKG